MKIVRRKIGEIVRYLGDQKNKISAPSQTVVTARIAPKVCNGQPPTFGSQHSKFHPNRFTFGGLTCEWVTQGHRQHSDLIERIQLPTQINRNYEAISYRFRDITAYFPKN